MKKKKTDIMNIRDERQHVITDPTDTKQDNKIML